MFVSLKASITCSVGVDGRTSWWITKESGAVPDCTSVVPCVWCRGLSEPSVAELRVAYLVVKCEWLTGDRCHHEVLFARLTVHGLDALTQRALPHLLVNTVRAAEGTVSVRALWAVLELLDSGMFSVSGCECCMVHGMCSSCSDVPCGSRRFVWQNRYVGSLSSVGGGWGPRVTDAVGMSCGDRPWLACPLL